MFEVVGPSLTLRLPRVEDVPALYAMASDPEVTRWFSWGPYTSDHQPRAWVADAERRRRIGDRLELVVERDHEVLGVTTVAEVVRRDRRATIGTWFGREHWGTGVNPESKRMMFQLCFDVLGCERLTAYAEIDHERSQKALEKVGFQREGVLRGWHRHPNGTHDVVIFGLLRGEWEPLPGVEVRGEPPDAFVVG